MREDGNAGMKSGNRKKNGRYLVGIMRCDRAEAGRDGGLGSEHGGWSEPFATTKLRPVGNHYLEKYCKSKVRKHTYINIKYKKVCIFS